MLLSEPKPTFCSLFRLAVVQKLFFVLTAKDMNAIVVLIEVDRQIHTLGRFHLRAI